MQNPPYCLYLQAVVCLEVVMGPWPLCCLCRVNCPGRWAAGVCRVSFVPEVQSRGRTWSKDIISTCGRNKQLPCTYPVSSGPLNLPERLKIQSNLCPFPLFYIARKGARPMHLTGMERRHCPLDISSDLGCVVSSGQRPLLFTACCRII